MGKLFFNILATFAEFEVDVIPMRTREGIADDFRARLTDVGVTVRHAVGDHLWPIGWLCFVGEVHF
jgi:hypothetical protein